MHSNEPAPPSNPKGPQRSPGGASDWRELLACDQAYVMAGVRIAALGMSISWRKGEMSCRSSEVLQVSPLAEEEGVGSAVAVAGAQQHLRGRAGGHRRQGAFP
jgi:hypothetical protein